MYRKKYCDLSFYVTAGGPVSTKIGTDYLGERFMHQASVYFTDETASY